MPDLTIKIGTAGWSIPRAVADRFPYGPSHLARYAQRLPAVEINSSFYRPHQFKTYVRWAATVPDGFRFAVKLPKVITHDKRLLDGEALLDRFLGEIAGLGAKLGPVLVQLPPSLSFDPAVAAVFFTNLRERFPGILVCEPRHESWFTDEADALLTDGRFSGATRGLMVGGWPGLLYRRLHGSPRIYYSDYAPAYLAQVADGLASPGQAREQWCIFDNTALGCASANALAVQDRLKR